jgi:hypothetical protein
MRKILGVVAFVILAGLGLWFVYLTAPGSALPDTNRTQTSLKRQFVATISPEGGEPSVGPLSSWTLSIRTPDGKPVRDATVSVEGGMPEHDHGLPTAPAVSTDLGDGRYRVEGVKFSMPGRWILRFQVATPDGKRDEATFNIML